MKLAEKIKAMLSEQLPKGLKIGDKYKEVIVDGETFKGLTLQNINSTKSELIFKKGSNTHTFNYTEQDVKVKK